MGDYVVVWRGCWRVWCTRGVPGALRLGVVVRVGSVPCEVVRQPNEEGYVNHTWIGGAYIA